MLSAVLLAVRNWIREELELDDSSCRIMTGPQPPPSCGDRFLSVYGRRWAPGSDDLNRGIDETYEIAVAVTYRCSFSPFDERGEAVYIQHLESMERTLRQLLGIHLNMDILHAINSRVHGSYKLIEPLRWRGCDASPTLVGPEWFQSRGGGGSDPAGMVMEASFGGARRLIPYAEGDF